jgi:hypothetical protein
MSQIPESLHPLSDAEDAAAALEELDVLTARLRMKHAATWMSRDEARAEGFAQFNNGEHLVVNLPDGPRTISVRLSDGRQVTFAFIPYVEGGIPRCIDIKDHQGNGSFVKNGEAQVTAQTLHVWTCGHPLYSAVQGTGATMITLMLDPAEPAV